MVRRDPWRKLVQQGLLASVDDLYPQMPNRTKIQYDENSRAFTTINGKSYGLASPGAVAKNEGVLIRKDWLDKLKLPVPVTTDDFFNVMKAFTENDPDGNGRKDTYGYGAFIEINNYEEGFGRRIDPLFGAFGVPGTWNLKKGTAGMNLLKAEYYDAMAYFKKICDAGYIDPNWSSYKKDDFRAAWKQGRFGIMREQNAAYAAQNNYAPFDKNFPEGSWIIVDPPKGPKGQQSVGVFIQDYRIYAVSKKAADAGKGAAIAKLLEWMSGPEGYYLLGWGEKGVNYNLDANGVPSTAGLPDPSKAFDKPEIAPLTQLRNMVFYNSDVELAARYPTYKTATSGKTMSALTVLREMQGKAWTANAGGNQIPAPNADLKRFYEQGVMEFINNTRQLTPQGWQQFIDQFKSMGGQKYNDDSVKFAEEQGYVQ
jgi:putative aldouronate transport system substrate-binding protein